MRARRFCPVAWSKISGAPPRFVEIHRAITKRLQGTAASSHADGRLALRKTPLNQRRRDEDAIMVDARPGRRQNLSRTGVIQHDTGLVEDAERRLMDGFDLFRGQAAEKRHSYSISYPSSGQCPSNPIGPKRTLDKAPGRLPDEARPARRPRERRQAFNRVGPAGPVDRGWFREEQ